MKFMERCRRVVRNAKSRALYNYLPKAVDWAVRVAASSARKRILEQNASRVLVDNTVIGHAVTHETAWIDTGRQMWGGKVPIDTGFAARIPVHREDDDSDAVRSVRFLPAIASLARQGALTLYSSPELMDERLTQPIGRFSGYGYYDYSVFSGIRFEHLDDPAYSMCIGPAYLGVPSLTEQRRARLAAQSDPLFHALVEVLGPGNSQDAWHIATAESSGCFCFLTMDFRLLRAVASQQKHPAIANLKTRVMSPETFGQLFRLLPVSPRLFSYHNASYPVHPEFNWPDSRRRKRRSASPRS